MARVPRAEEIVTKNAAETITGGKVFTGAVTMGGAGGILADSTGASIGVPTKIANAYSFGGATGLVGNSTGAHIGVAFTITTGTSGQGLLGTAGDSIAGLHGAGSTIGALVGSTTITGTSAGAGYALTTDERAQLSAWITAVQAILQNHGLMAKS